LTATLAHDLGTPLHSIAGMARLLLERGDWPADVARKLELIVQQTERLHETIQNVRQATRLPDPRFETVTVADLFNDTLPLVEPLLARTGIECRIRIAESLPRVDMDRHRVQTALLNLIHNAIEAMPGGGILTLAAAPAPGGDGMALSVQDTGLGIPPELQGEVCKPFFSTHREEGLRGLGLAIVQDTVKLHRGRIAIESEPGKGTQVTLFLPRSAS
jgi:signal transduction histidine kinase